MGTRTFFRPVSAQGLEEEFWVKREASDWTGLGSWVRNGGPERGKGSSGALLGVIGHQLISPRGLALTPIISAELQACLRD